MWRLHLHVPFTYWGDALYFDTWVKGLMEGNWPWHNARIGMPFGADWRDFPVTLTLEALAVRILALFTSSPGLILNLIWLLGTAACAGFATYGLQRLGVQRWIAGSLGIVYALQPFTFYRGVGHFNLMFYLVPLLATGAIEIAVSRIPQSQNFPRTASVTAAWPKRLIGILRITPPYLYLACFAQGLSYIYNSFFAVVLFAVAALLAYAVSRRKSSLVAGFVVIALTCGVVSITLAPTLLYRAKHGTNPEMAYKSAVQGEIYGLKLRHLFTPIPGNPLPPLHYIQKKLDSAGFTDDNENATSRLGTLGGLGLLFLLAWVLYSCLRKPSTDDRSTSILGACSALALTCLLLATVGGFGSLFNVFVAPDIRCYNRVVVFIDFFAITAVGLLLTRAWVWSQRRNWPKPIVMGVLGLLVVFGVSDQAVTTTYLDHVPREQQFKLDAAFVKSVESILPRNASVFQLPFTEFPADGGTVQMLGYDHSRAYLHSHTLRWSWGGMSGREAGEWVRDTSRLPVREMLTRLSAAGFSGIWVDRFGYNPGTSPELKIAAELGEQGTQRSDSRIAFYDLRPYTEYLRKTNTPGEIHLLQEYASHPVEVTFPVGFYGEERNDKQTWRWCSRHGVMQFHNPVAQPRTVRLAMTLQTGWSEPYTIVISAEGKTDAIKVTTNTALYARKLLLQPGQTVSVSFDCNCKPVNAPPGESRNLYFALIDPKISE
ncbi:MAG: hypothetical protein M3Y72_18870 [Acidobacteriota bacterium]|nr:hypothetical protein [Acidobacteriota bacterium]